MANISCSIMKAHSTTLLLILLGFTFFSSGQSIIELSFTGVNNTSHVDLDSILVRNVSWNCDTTLYWPDTVLVLGFVGVPEHPADYGFFVSPAYPNPANGVTEFNIQIPFGDEVKIMVTDMLGRFVLLHKSHMEAGNHKFNFFPSDGQLYYLSVYWKNKSESLKIISHNSIYRECKLEYNGLNNVLMPWKKNDPKGDFIYMLGDELLYIGYHFGFQSGLLDAPVESENYVFQFAVNIPCPEAPYIIYGGRIYNTVQIAAQCWMKENLDFGTMIPGNQEMEDNGIIEKYCFFYSEDSCEALGGLYQWEEVMAYENQPGAQGICPPGWHIPTDEEWKILEGTTDSQYPIGDSLWDQEGMRGFDAGNMLKSSSGWLGSGNGSNKSGFTARGGGMRNMFGFYTGCQRTGYYWSSSEHSDFLWVRVFDIYGDYVNRRRDKDFFGFSVRCLKDL